MPDPRTTIGGSPHTTESHANMDETRAIPMRPSAAQPEPIDSFELIDRPAPSEFQRGWRAFSSWVNGASAAVGLSGQKKDSAAVLGRDAAQIEAIDQLTQRFTPPSHTVRKLLEKTGPVEGRLSDGDLQNLAEALTHGVNPSVNVLDGYSQTSAGLGYAQLRSDVYENGRFTSKSRRPSDAISAAYEANRTNKILLPFTYPSAGGLSEAHIVLVTADPVNKVIRYFDPKGDSADQRSLKSKFADQGTPFSMHKDLEELKSRLDALERGSGLNGTWEIAQNTTPYQLDPTNCGSYIARAIQDEANGKQAGSGWKTGPAWINQEKEALAQRLWAHFKGKHEAQSK